MVLAWFEGIGHDCGNKWLSRVEDKIAGQGHGTKLLITVKWQNLQVIYLLMFLYAFLREKKRVELWLINWKFIQESCTLFDHQISCGPQWKRFGLRTAFLRCTYLAAACRPQALMIWTEMETAWAARIPSAVLGVRLYLSPTSSKPDGWFL